MWIWIWLWCECGSDISIDRSSINYKYTIKAGIRIKLIVYQFNGFPLHKLRIEIDSSNR